jgi:hypothetical protein
MSFLRQIDEFLLRVFTFNSRYKRFEERPQTTLALVSTFVLLMVLLGSFVGDGPAWIGILSIVVMGLSTIYEWRLWVRLRKQGIVSPVTEGISLFSPLIYSFYQIRDLLGKKDSG